MSALNIKKDDGRNRSNGLKFFKNFLYEDIIHKYSLIVDKSSYRNTMFSLVHHKGETKNFQLKKCPRKVLDSSAYHGALHRYTTRSTRIGCV